MRILRAASDSAMTLALPTCVPECCPPGSMPLRTAQASQSSTAAGAYTHCNFLYELPAELAALSGSATLHANTSMAQL